MSIHVNAARTARCFPCGSDIRGGVNVGVDPRSQFRVVIDALSLLSIVGTPTHRHWQQQQADSLRSYQ